MDLTDPTATRAVVDKAKSLFGNVDILINNAGWLVMSSFLCNAIIFISTHFLYKLKHSNTSGSTA